MATTVVNIKSGEPYDIYIGRSNWSRRLPKSEWYNPFRIGWEGTREEVIERYRQRLLNRPDLMARLPELRDKVLGCWCAPLPCHGDVLAELADNAR